MSASRIPDSLPPFDNCCHTAFDALEPLSARKEKEYTHGTESQTVLVDDLDGTEATETVSFGLDGSTYEIDLNDANAAALREALSGYVGHARKSTGGSRRTRRSCSSALDVQHQGRTRVGQGKRHGRLRARPHLRRRAVGLRRRPLTYAP